MPFLFSMLVFVLHSFRVFAVPYVDSILRFRSPIKNVLIQLSCCLGTEGLQGSKHQTVNRALLFGLYDYTTFVLDDSLHFCCFSVIPSLLGFLSMACDMLVSGSDHFASHPSSRRLPTMESNHVLLEPLSRTRELRNASCFSLSCS